EIQRIRCTWSKRHRRIEVHRVRDVQAIKRLLGSAVTRSTWIGSHSSSTKLPRVFHRQASTQIRPARSNQNARDVQERAIHADVGGVDSPLINEVEPAITALSTGPGSRYSGLCQRSVVLRAANRKVSGSRVNRDALKLQRSQRGVIAIDPGRARR